MENNGSPPWINPEERNCWFDTKETASILRVSLVTLYRWISNGYIENTLGIKVYRAKRKIYLRVSG